ncbi:MAG: endonuclease [Bacteroidia bacterium]|nr:endonuclease [Bacteroidia bacterium]
MRFFLLLFCLISSLCVTSQAIVINELDCDTPSIDDKEFVELKTQTPNSSLDGYVLVFFNGSTSGGDSSYLTIDLDGYVSDSNGLMVIGSVSVSPYPQLLISENVIQNGADAVAIYQASPNDFPEGTLATITNLVDVLIYDTSDADDIGLIDIFNDDPNFADIQQINEGSGNNTNSIQRNTDGTYFTGTPTPRQLNDGSGIVFTTITISTNTNEYNEGDPFDITFLASENVTAETSFNISLNNGGFDATDFSGNTTITIPNGQNSASTTINLVDDNDDEGDEVLEIQFTDLVEPVVAGNNRVQVRVVDNDFTVAAYGSPIAPTYGTVLGTQPSDYYDSLEGLADDTLRTALQNKIAEEGVVRAQTYTDVIDILKEADQNPNNSNQVWLVYSEEGRPKLDFQTTSSSTGKWNREHTFPRSRGGFSSIDLDDISDGIDVFWNTTADSLRHGNSDAHALRAADALENSSRGNQHYGEYTGPTGNLGSFYGDVARSVLYMEIRYNGLHIVNGFPEGVSGVLGDLAILLNWHRNDPPDDFEMNRNNVVYNWQKNRNPFIDYPDLVEHLWGNKIGEAWSQPLSIVDTDLSDISIYPNPSHGEIYITGFYEPLKLEIYSITGSRIMRLDEVYQQMTLNLESGVYFLKIIQEDNVFETRKLIITK